MATVWRARHLVLLSSVALKVLTEAQDEDGRARFLREARAAAALRSPHVVQILDYGLHEDVVPYIAMELLEGETLARRLGAGRRLPWREVVRIVTHVARAIGNAHEMGIVHRDLKPENIFLVRYHDEEVAKVLDFGIAKLLRTADPVQHITEVGMIIGTPVYMSPEQARGHSSVDHRSDLWSLAIIAFECVCGAQPFSATTMGALAVQICADPLPVPSALAAVPPAFDRWFDRAAARDPDARFQTAKELADALADALDSDAEATALAGAPIDELADSYGSTEVANASPRPGLQLASDPPLRAEASTLLAAANTSPHPDGAISRWPWRAFGTGVAVAFAGAAVATAIALASRSSDGGAASEPTIEPSARGSGDLQSPPAPSSQVPIGPTSASAAAAAAPDAGAPSATASASAAPTAPRAPARPGRSGAPRTGDDPRAAPSAPLRPAPPAPTQEDLGI